MMNRFFLYVSVVLISLLLIACPPINLAPINLAPTTTSNEVLLTPVTKQPSSTPNSTSATVTVMPQSDQVTVIHITVVGIGIGPDTETNPARRERAAVRSAELDAKRNFAQWQEGAQLESVTVVDQGTLETDIIRETIKADIYDLGTIIEQQYDNATGTARIVVDYAIEVAR